MVIGAFSCFPKESTWEGAWGTARRGRRKQRKFSMYKNKFLLKYFISWYLLPGLVSTVGKIGHLSRATLQQGPMSPFYFSVLKDSNHGPSRHIAAHWFRVSLTLLGPAATSPALCAPLYSPFSFTAATIFFSTLPQVL